MAIISAVVAQTVKNPPAMQATRVPSLLGWGHPLEEGVATRSSILALRIPWTEEPGRLQSLGSQRVRHDWATNTTQQCLSGSDWRESVLMALCAPDLVGNTATQQWVETPPCAWEQMWVEQAIAWFWEALSQTLFPLIPYKSPGDSRQVELENAVTS